MNCSKAMGPRDRLLGVLPPSFQLHFVPPANVPSDVQVFLSFTLAAAGVMLGSAVAQLAAHSLSALLYCVSASDPASYALALLLLPASALLGCWRPAWRAASASPAQTIRSE
jgi:hypothetical protein